MARLQTRLGSSSSHSLSYAVRHVGREWALRNQGSNVTAPPSIRQPLIGAWARCRHWPTVTHRSPGAPVPNGGSCALWARTNLADGASCPVSGRPRRVPMGASSMARRLQLGQAKALHLGRPFQRRPPRHRPLRRHLRRHHYRTPRRRLRAKRSRQSEPGKATVLLRRSRRRANSNASKKRDGASKLSRMPLKRLSACAVERKAAVRRLVLHQSHEPGLRTTIVLPLKRPSRL